VRFWEAVKHDDGRLRAITRERDVERDASPERQAAEFGHG
jgi:hypothetical protein